MWNAKNEDLRKEEMGPDDLGTLAQDSWKLNNSIVMSHESLLVSMPSEVQAVIRRAKSRHTKQ